ncbi:MAG TPA: S41 family peptidase [Acidimicrobiia bacterium]|nr:S41 family peptidase [Acidimicrobiia bacterium]
MTAGYYRHPTISGNTIVFVSEDDLWRVEVDGGPAVRLTANPGTETFPVLSPDGLSVAFTSRDEGHPEAYVMSAEGGPPRRLTFLGVNTQVVGWSLDGGRVLVASDWRRPFPMDQHIHAIPAEGGEPILLPVGPARAISFQRGGPGVVIGRNSRDPARWKRYRGGTTGTLWVDRQGDGEFEPLVRLEGNLANPMWVGRRIYFLSDHEGTGNLYSVTPTGRGLERHTDHEAFYARFPSSDGRRIVYHVGADLWVFDPVEDSTRQLEVLTPSARPQRARRFMAPGRHLETIDLHPKGHSLALVARGAAVTIPLWEGAPVRHGPASSVRQRLATWLPDGERLVTLSDAEGEESIVVWSADGTAPPRVIKTDIGRATDMVAAPTGRDRVALSNQRQELIVVDLAQGRLKQIARSDYERIQGIAWSADGRWLAYAAYTSPRRSAIFVYDTVSGRTRQVTRPDFVDVGPSFDPDGRYLYFVSWRVFDPVYDGHYHDYGFPRGGRPHLVTLRASEPSPFSATQRQPRAPGQPAGPGEGVNKTDAGKTGVGEAASTKEPTTPVVEVDFDGIEDRVIAFPVPEGRYGRVLGARGRVLFTSYPVEGTLAQPAPDGPPEPKGKIEAWDFTQEKVEPVMEGVLDMTVSMDGKVVGALAGKKVRVVAVGFKEGDKSNDKPNRETGWLDLSRVRLEVVPGEEWRQMFREAWRLQRDQYWTPDMAGIDWIAVHDRYFPLVDRVGSRSEFSDLLWEMQGELGTSHAYELGGDYRPEPGWFQGFLGADLEPSGRSWRVARIPRGDSWDEAARSPLATPGLEIAEGDRLVGIDGVALDGTVPYERLVDRAGRPVLLTVQRGRRKPRSVAAVALRNEFPLRYRDWVEANRAKVHDRSDERVGYVHIPDMGSRGFSEFHRYFGGEVDRDGLVIDVRNNGGGNVSGLLLEKLARRRVAYTVTRWGQPDPYPDDAPLGPMVALTNEHAGSDGDIFCHAFKLYRLGPLIGVRTWGGVVGIWPRHVLVDGTVTTQPEFAFWFEDVGWSVENYGTDPDIVVEMTPQDYAAGRDPQLDRAIDEVLGIVERWGPSAPSFEPPPSRQAPRLPLIDPPPAPASDTPI